MAHRRVPGLSLAIISNFEIVRVESYGVANARTKVPVTPDTLFQAGSLSKALTAAGALRAVGERKLDAHADIDCALRSWRLPDNELTQGSAGHAGAPLAPHRWPQR